jgi:hypothetical protein
MLFSPGHEGLHEGRAYWLERGFEVVAGWQLISARNVMDIVKPCGSEFRRTEKRKAAFLF